MNLVEAVFDLFQTARDRYPSCSAAPEDAEPPRMIAAQLVPRNRRRYGSCDPRLAGREPREAVADRRPATAPQVMHAAAIHLRQGHLGRPAGQGRRVGRMMRASSQSIDSFLYSGAHEMGGCGVDDAVVLCGFALLGFAPSAAGSLCKSREGQAMPRHQPPRHPSETNAADVIAASPMPWPTAARAAWHCPTGSRPDPWPTDAADRYRQELIVVEVEEIGAVEDVAPSAGISSAPPSTMRSSHCTVSTLNFLQRGIADAVRRDLVGILHLLDEIVDAAGDERQRAARRKRCIHWMFGYFTSAPLVSKLAQVRDHIEGSPRRSSRTCPDRP